MPKKNQEIIPLEKIIGPANEHEDYVYSWPSFTLFFQQQLFSDFSKLFLQEAVALSFFTQDKKKNLKFSRAYFWEEKYFYRDSLINVYAQYSKIGVCLQFTKESQFKVRARLDINIKKYELEYLDESKFKYQEEIKNFLNTLTRYYILYRNRRIAPIKNFYYEIDEPRFLSGGCHN